MQRRLSGKCAFYIHAFSAVPSVSHEVNSPRLGAARAVQCFSARLRRSLAEGFLDVAGAATFVDLAGAAFTLFVALALRAFVVTVLRCTAFCTVAPRLDFGT